MAKKCSKYTKKSECDKQDKCEYKNGKCKDKKSSGSLTDQQKLFLGIGIASLVIGMGLILVPEEPRLKVLGLFPTVMGIIIIALVFTVFKKKKCKDIDDKGKCEENEDCKYINKKCLKKSETEPEPEPEPEPAQKEKECADITRKYECKKRSDCKYKRGVCGDATTKPWKLSDSTLTSVKYICNDEVIDENVADKFMRQLNVAGYNTKDGVVTDKEQVLCGMPGFEDLEFRVESDGPDDEEDTKYSYKCDRYAEDDYKGKYDDPELDGSIRFWNKLEDKVDKDGGVCLDSYIESLDSDAPTPMRGDYSKYEITYVDDDGTTKSAIVPWGRKINLVEYAV